MEKPKSFDEEVAFMRSAIQGGQHWVFLWDDAGFNFMEQLCGLLLVRLSEDDLWGKQIDFSNEVHPLEPATSRRQGD